MNYRLYQLVQYIRYVFIFRLNKILYWRDLGVKIGDECEILLSLMDFQSEPWLIEIGNQVTIAPKVTFVTHDASTRLFRNRYPEMNHRYGNSFGNIKILENSFIGTNSIILPNVTIGPNSIVGAGSVVTKNVDPNTVVAGNPARMIYTLDDFIRKSINNLLPIRAKTRHELRDELTQHYWNEYR